MHKIVLQKIKQMKRFLLASLSLTLIFGSCKKKDDNNNTTPPTTTDSVQVITGDISSNTTFNAGKKYMLKGFVFVKDGATLTIEPGTVIMGDKATKGTLIVTRGGKINATGTATKPIIFTSAQAAGARSQGDWGGLIILGKAPINPAGGEAKIEGGLTATSGGDEKKYIWYGGTDVNDNSGTLKYVRIEFAGIAYSPDNEINGLTLGGVGAGTTISYVQVYRSGDDAFEWFGGTVNCDHLVATYSWDDDFDTDFGYSGHVQFGVAQRAKTVADVSGSNGFESDNDANGSAQIPQTKAMFANMTIVGPITAGNSASGINANFQHGAQIRRNSSQSIFNSIFTGFPIGIYIDGTKGVKTIENVKSNSLMLKGNLIAGCAKAWKSDALATADSTYILALKGMNNTVSNVEDAALTDAFKYSAALAAAVGVPNFLPTAASPAMSGAVDISGMGFSNTTYRGAFGTDNWTSGWTTWAAENTHY